MGEPLLQMRGITKVFPGVKALDRVDFELERGEIHALIGENGAGKSTLMKVLLGIYSPDGGEIVLRGGRVEIRHPHDAVRAGISMIHQEISLVQSMSVSENIWIGRESRFKRFGLLDGKARDRATAALLDELGLGQLGPREKVQNLSIAGMQLVEIARAVSYESDIIIMDEPTSSLTNVEIGLLYKIMRSLVAKGVSIVFISHKLEEIFEICSRITVLRDGRSIVTKRSDELTMDALISHIVGRELTEMFPKLPAEIGRPVLEARHLSRAGVFEDVSFTVRAGEIFGVSGLVGAGRSEIMRAIFGIDRLDGGQVLVEGRTVRIRDPREAIRHGLGMVTEDRLLTGSIYQLSVMANMTLSHFRALCNRAGFSRPSRERAAFAGMSRVSIKYSSPKEKISQLSGGNQQKVIISRWLMTRPKVLILDEPTRGIDVGSKSEIHRLISELAQQGMAIILVSSELPEILGMSDTVAVVRNGRIVGVCDRADATQERLISLSFGYNE